MTQLATVEQRLEGDRVRIAVARQSACGHNCESCAGCGAVGQVVRAIAHDPLGVSPGDRVLVYSDDKPVLQAAALVYLMPILTFFLSYGLSARLDSLLLCALITLCGTALGVVPALLLDRRSQIRFEIQTLL
ncbi:MAG: SoxR reducing system RseC family protein [Oscillospiraceae bacterium]|jgi:sigma-E factor negative regulatory protein RseC|nr:SoxR reducing system RseC family protein [Oscillospiraceae bacterium]